MHGMGNRLRALAFAMVLAEKSWRWLKVISPPQDVHFQARLDDIIDLPASGLPGREAAAARPTPSAHSSPNSESSIGSSAATSKVSLRSIRW